ncbi:Amino acid-[acyl-carrier-protein] ligase [Hartmannibacter diazotrophicus]|uniref:Amino acid-[acyl-carrier-protein] ligase n=1 Tax=Hartmannibacter diazotrophicus TaxID=1482074 RepID=A0A2C9DCX2_9HYPH|nr:amino acid--[acyl-carrier-protein] ligase [Hartmannibacter diazotrophicus]SON57465.1 Amino acid-[acyl-carrier-protein] ligase [Hartmannibacter diazotrophicus]
MDVQGSFLDQLFDRGLLIETGVDGLYGRSGVFEDVIARFDALVTRYGEADGAEVMRFPPGMSRPHFEKSGYLKSFPQLAGTVHSFCGDDQGHARIIECLATGEDWTGEQKATDVVLTPAACYPLYPVIAKRGPLPPEGRLFDLQSYCFRHEPSLEPTRMQLFRMREYVRAGTPEQVVDFRESWLERGQELIKSLALPMKVDVANDPFFGRAGRMMKVNQRDQGLKFELLVPVNSEESPTACLSFNYHQNHFGQTWGIATDAGETAHTACVGFGLERVALALFRHHGLDVKTWPKPVRETLWG